LTPAKDLIARIAIFPGVFSAKRPLPFIYFLVNFEKF